MHAHKIPLKSSSKQDYVKTGQMCEFFLLWIMISGLYLLTIDMQEGENGMANNEAHLYYYFKYHKRK